MTQLSPEDNSVAITAQSAEFHRQVKLHKDKESIHAGNNAWNLATNLLRMGVTLEELGVTQEELQGYLIQSWLLIVQAFRDKDYAPTEIFGTKANIMDALDLQDFEATPPVPGFFGLISCTPEEVAQFIGYYTASENPEQETPQG